MANPILYYQDSAGRWPIITSTVSEDAAYPLSNLITGFPDQKWQSSSIADGQALNMDTVNCYPSSKTVIIVSGHNIAELAASGGVILIQHDTASNFPSPTTIATYNDSSPLPPDPIILNFAATTERYFRISYTYTGGYKPIVGQVWFGYKFTFDFPYEYPFKIGNKDFKTEESMTLDGRVRASQAYGGRQIAELKFMLLNDTNKTSWNTFYNHVRGRLYPFYFVDTDGTIYYFKLEIDKNPVEAFRYNLNSWEKVPMKAVLVS